MAATNTVIFVVGYSFILIFANPTSRILGGEEAAKNSFPFVASVRLDGVHVCGGSIIESRFILTAAHCLKEYGNDISANRLAIRVGSTNQFSGGKLYFVNETVIHPSYAVEENDIAVLKLESPLQWSSRIQKIDIATTSQDDPVPGDLVKVAGWGEQLSQNSAHKLHSRTFSIANEDTCLDAFSRKGQSKVCLSHDLRKGSCVGDAGNGAVYKNKLVAVSSFIIGACGSRYPDIFYNVSHFASWIKTVTV